MQANKYDCYSIAEEAHRRLVDNLHKFDREEILEILCKLCTQEPEVSLRLGLAQCSFILDGRRNDSDSY